MRRFGCMVLAWLALGVAAAAAQGTYPNKPIRILIPYAPGGLTDVVARHYAEHLRKAFGQNVLVENKPGASGIIAIEEMARAKPDGYTLEIGNISTNCLTPVLLKKRMLTEALRSFVMRIAWEHDHKLHSANAGLAMNFSTDVIQEVTELNLEIHGETARDADGLAGDVGGIVGQQKRNQPRIVFRLAEAPHRDRAFERVGNAGAFRPLQKALQDRGVSRTRADGVDDNALADQLARRGLGKRDDAALAGRVDGLAGGADPAGVGGDVDHTTEFARGHDIERIHKSDQQARQDTGSE